MTTTSAKRLPFLATVLTLSWGCASDSPGPSADPEVSQSTTTVSAVTYTVRSLGTLGGNSSHAFGINDPNMVVGSSAIRGSLESHAFVWKNGVMTDLGTLTGGRGSTARAINNDGVIVGSSLNQAGFQRAVRWMNGAKRNLGTLGGKNSEALAISPLGVIVGWSEIANGNRHAFRWENGVMIDLGTLGGPTSTARDINRGGAIVGESRTASGETHAFRWKDGVMTDLGTHGTELSAASGINSMGQIVGILGAKPDDAGEERDWFTVFLFHRNVWTILRSSSTNHVEDISPVSVVVGWDEDLRAEDDLSVNAWVWQSGEGSTTLPELAPGSARAFAVNQSGIIVGSSQNVNGKFRAVMWSK
jgi:probable HAF family extracellular repeat protein